MKALLALIPVLLLSSNASAYSRGKLNCRFEIVSKKNFPAVTRLPAFEFDVMKTHEDSFEADVLENPLRFRYTPGLTGLNDVRVFVIDLAYNMANGGADVPAAPNAGYVFKIGRQDSDLVGAFLNCTAKELE